MPVSFKETLRQLLGWVGQIVQGLILQSAIGLAAATTAGVLGLLPWPELGLSYGGQGIPMAGMWAQIALTGLMPALVFYLPAHLRVARLERSH